MSLSFITILEKGKATYINMSYVRGIRFENLDAPWVIRDENQSYVVDATRVEIWGDGIEHIIMVSIAEADALQIVMQSGADLYQGISLTVLPDKQLKPAE